MIFFCVCVKKYTLLLFSFCTNARRRNVVKSVYIIIQKQYPDVNHFKKLRTGLLVKIKFCYMGVVLSGSSQKTFCTDVCGSQMMSLYNSGRLAFIYLYPPASYSFSAVNVAEIISSPNVLHSAMISPKGSMIIEQPFFNWSSSMPIGLEKIV